MALLIDGYNLLHVTGVVGGAGSGLQGSREALLRFLLAAIDAKELRETTVVFDAAEAPPGLPHTIMYETMTVRYASDYTDADELIEELIAAHHVPRSLTVVSSDHRIQRAARRRRAPFVDSDVWFADALRRRNQARRPSRQDEARTTSLSPQEVAFWLEEFESLPIDETSGSSTRLAADELDHPFPPGYAEDVTGD